MPDPNLRYEDPAPLEHSEARDIFRGADVNVISRTLVAAALHDDDREWVEEQCWQLADHSDPRVRGTAGLCLGHVARRFGAVRVVDSRQTPMRRPHSRPPRL